MFYWFVSAFHSSEEDEVLQQKLKNRLIWFVRRDLLSYVEESQTKTESYMEFK